MRLNVTSVTTLGMSQEIVLRVFRNLMNPLTQIWKRNFGKRKVKI
jgi:hypothetical protein